MRSPQPYCFKELLDLKLSTLKSSIDGWNRIGFWLLTAIGGAFIAGVVAFVISGGLRVVG